MFKILTSITLFAFLISCSNTPVSSISNGFGTVSIVATAPASSPFGQIAKKAEIIITANDMSSSSKVLSISGSAVKGVMNNIPSGKNRKFDIKIYDSLSVVKYKGSAISDVEADETVSIPITLVRTAGDAIINGTITEDSITTGFQFYKFTINSVGSLGGGTNVVCLTETHFLKGDTVFPRNASDYTVISNSSIYSSGSMASLFDGDLGVGTGSYAKPLVTPWEWVIDMHQARTFTGFKMVCWETFFYQVPTSVTLYGATAAGGPWVQIGGQEFSAAYETATVDLFY